MPGHARAPKPPADFQLGRPRSHFLLRNEGTEGMAPRPGRLYTPCLLTPLSEAGLRSACLRQN